MGMVVRLHGKRHVRASADSAAWAMPQRAGGARKPRSRKASDITTNISAGIEGRLRQFDTACAGLPTKRATTAVPPSASITASTDLSSSGIVIMEPHLYTHRVHGKHVHLVCSPDLGILVPSRAMAKRPAHPRSVEMITKRLIALRIAIGPNQRRFAINAGIGTNTWGNYEKRGTRISLDEAFKLVDRYGVSLDWIYEGKAAMMPDALMEKIRAAEPEAARKVA